MRAFYARVAELLAAGRTFKLAHLVETRGSAPQRPGAKLLVHPDGATEFTIGGGALEERVKAEAMRLGPGSEALLLEYRLSDLGMFCGGAVKVFIEPAPAEAELYRRMQELLSEVEAERLVLAHFIGPRPAKMALFEGGLERSSGDFPADLVEAVREEAQALLTRGGTAFREYGADQVFLEVVESLPRLLIFGAGHVGRKLAQLAAATELFQVEVADERPDLLEGVTPFVARTHHIDYRGELPLPDRRTFVAIVTHSHETDRLVLGRLLRHGVSPAYLGMIGSMRKRIELFRRLAQEGLPAERLERVHTPIGLPIGGSEPGEIAVSILAEMIKVKNSMELEGE
ncbi:MAG: XdhC family protein [Candidatus Bipolaricaulia bacterium]